MFGKSLQAKFLTLILFVFLIVIFCISSGASWWGYHQYKQELEQNLVAMQVALNYTIQSHMQELAFLGEAIPKNKKFNGAAKCFIKYLSGKSIKRCAKKKSGNQS
ncbi:MAG: hypothetical protein MI799_20990 [Desulfobacterales bacterium]|nr:hypothetical protein [Desulfobacterales bacterium]